MSTLTHKEQTAYEQGIQAGANKGVLDDCKYRRSDLKAQWVRAFHTSKLQNTKTISTVQKIKNTYGISKLKTLLGEKQ